MVIVPLARIYVTKGGTAREHMSDNSHLGLLFSIVIGIEYYLSFYEHLHFM